MGIEFVKRNVNAKRSKDRRVASDLTSTIRNKQRVVDKSSKSGIVPIYNSEPKAIYDTLPLNATGFNFSTLGTWTVSGAAGDVLQVNYTIPNGRNAVLRGFKYEMIPTLSIAVNSLLLDIFIDGSAPNRDNLGQMYGQVMDNYEDTYLLIGAGSVLTLNFRALVALGPAASTRTTYVCVRGDLLLDTGLPLNQEASNKRSDKPILKKV